MKPMRNVLVIAAAAALIAGCGKFGGQPSVAEVGKEQWPLVKKYCGDCHNDSELAGGIDFAKINPDNVAEHAETLEMAVRKLRRMMVDLNPVEAMETLVAALKKHKTNEELLSKLL